MADFDLAVGELPSGPKALAFAWATGYRTPDFLVRFSSKWDQSAENAQSDAAAWGDAASAAKLASINAAGARHEDSHVIARWAESNNGVSPDAEPYAPSSASAADFDLFPGDAPGNPETLTFTWATYTDPNPPAIRINTPVLMKWGEGAEITSGFTTGWDATDARIRASAAIWRGASAKQSSAAAAWTAAATVSASKTEVWNAARSSNQPAAASWAVSEPGIPNYIAPGHIPSDAAAANFDLNESSRAINPESLAVAWSSIVADEPAKFVNASFVAPWGPGLRFDSERVYMPWEQESPVDEPGLPDAIPEQETYTVNSSLTVKRESDDKAINVLSASTGLTMGDFAWRARIALADAQGLEDLKPSGGSNQEAIISINGQNFWVIVESWSRSQAFGKATWVASCRGISAELDEPYFGRRDFISTSGATAAQLAADELAGTSWTINWPSELDYGIESGEFSYTGLTPIRAVARLAETGGAFVLPDPDSKTITIVSRLPYKPSDWSGETPAAIVYQAAVVSIGHSYQPRPSYDYIQVSGGTQGVTVEATKQGEPGSYPAPDIVDELLLDSTIAQERARVELYSSGPMAVEKRQWPIIAPVGVRVPGELIRNNDDVGSWFGLMKDVQVSGAWSDGGGLSCWQEVTQDRYDV